MVLSVLTDLGLTPRSQIYVDQAKTAAANISKAHVFLATGESVLTVTMT